MSAAPFHVSAHFSLVPASDRFVPIILDAVAGLARPGLAVETDAVTTLLSGSARTVLTALTDTFVRAAASGEHLVLPLIAARPGVVAGEASGVPAFVAPAETGVRASATVALVGSAVPTPAAVLGFLEGIGLAPRARGFALRLDGDVGVILAAGFHLLGHAPGAALQATVPATPPPAEAFA